MTAPSVGRPKNSSMLSRPTPRTARAVSLRRKRQTQTANPTRASTLTVGKRPLSKMRPVTNHPRTRRAPNES